MHFKKGNKEKNKGFKKIVQKIVLSFLDFACKIQSTLVSQTLTGPTKKVRHSECSRYRVFEITDASDEVM